MPNVIRIKDEQLTKQARLDLYESIHFYKDNVIERIRRLKSHIHKHKLINPRSMISYVRIIDLGDEYELNVYNQSGLTRIIYVESPFREEQ